MVYNVGNIYLKVNGYFTVVIAQKLAKKTQFIVSLPRNLIFKKTHKFHQN